MDITVIYTIIFLVFSSILGVIYLSFKEGRAAERRAMQRQNPQPAQEAAPQANLNKNLRRISISTNGVVID